MKEDSLKMLENRMLREYLDRIEVVYWSEFLATDPETGFDSRCYLIF
jgi:hypothetical protein